LQTSFDSLKIQHESDMKSRDSQIQELQHRIEKLKANPEIAEFKKEVGELNNPLAQQQVVFCHKLAIIQDISQSSDSRVNHYLI